MSKKYLVPKARVVILSHESMVCASPNAGHEPWEEETLPSTLGGHEPWGEDVLPSTLSGHEGWGEINL